MEAHSSKQHHDNYDSEFDSDYEQVKKRKREHDLVSVKEKIVAKTIVNTKDFYRNECGKEEGKQRRLGFLRLNAYDRHKKLINDYLLYHPGATNLLQRDTTNDRTDSDVLRENHQFLWDDSESIQSWEKRMAKKYYDKLFKEYCICDLRYYKENKIAMRWRTEDEVKKGTGQFTCGAKKCDYSKKLRSWEVNFGYIEKGIKKNALVKVRLCPDCSCKLNYRHQKKEVIKIKKKLKKRKRKQDNDNIADTLSTEDPTKTKAVANEDEKLENEDEEDIWKNQPVEEVKDKTIEDEFEDYLEDLLL